MKLLTSKPSLLVTVLALACNTMACAAADDATELDLLDDDITVDESPALASSDSDQLDEGDSDDGLNVELGTARHALSSFETGEVYTDLGANHHMWTKARLRPDGLLEANTRTATFTLFGGFTGGVQIFFVDRDDFIIGMTEPIRFGVDGKWIGRNDRTDYWSVAVSPDLIAGADHMVVTHVWADDWNRNLDRWLAVGRKLGDAWKDVVGTFGGSAGKGS